MAVYRLTPGRLDLEIVAGDDFSMTANVSGDRSAYTVTAYLEATPGGTSTALTCAVGSYAGGVTPITFSLADTVTDGLSGEYVWAARWSNSGDLRTFLHGNVTVVAEVVG